MTGPPGPHSGSEQPETNGALDEFGRISKYFKPLTRDVPGALGLTDDAALLDLSAGQTVVTTDMLVAGVHFFDTDPPELIAQKALRVNLSDLAGMGAAPLYYTLCLAAPKSLEEAWIAAFVGGLEQDQKTYGVTLIGGDSVSTLGPLSISITALGKVGAGKALLRSGARPGDDLYVTGTIGDSALGLKVLQGTLEARGRSELVDRYHLPQPRTELGPRLAGFASAAMDISDGLLQDAAHIAAASNASLVFEQAKVPLSPAARTVVTAAPEHWQTVLGGGDDYELLFSASPALDDALQALAQEAGVAVTKVGRVDASNSSQPVQIISPDGNDFEVTSKGYRHYFT